jgi:hypothetical protein
MVMRQLEMRPSFYEDGAQIFPYPAFCRGNTQDLGRKRRQEDKPRCAFTPDM